MTAKQASFRAHPSLAIIKYWGKQDMILNLPATSSLALNLKGLSTETSVRLCEKEDRVVVDDKDVDLARYETFFNNIRMTLKQNVFFHATSRNNFASCAGLASSASGFAALTCACVKAAGQTLSHAELSNLARLGSASAARSIFGGFVALPAGAHFAHGIYPEDFWPELRVLVVQVTHDQKPISSRHAMELTRNTSPYYDDWVKTSEGIFQGALEALAKKDLDALGPFVRMSTLRMFATMLGAEPPVLYWRPETLHVIHLCEKLRQQGIAAWETMDAGPQVKILCLDDNIQTIRQNIASILPDACLIESAPGGAPVELLQ